MRSFLVGRVAVLAFAAGVSVLALARTGEAQTTDLFAGTVDAGFEGSGGGWEALGGGTLVVDDSGPVHGGTQAARIEASDLQAAGIRSQYWLTPTVAGATHTLGLWLYDDDPLTSALRVELEFLDSGGRRRGGLVTELGNGTSGWRLVTLTQVAPDGTAYVRTSARAEVSGAGARFYVDDVSLERGPAPVVTPSATASPSPTASATSTVSPTSTPSSTPSPPATPTATATASVPRVFDVLTNGGFEDGLYGWADVGADIEAVGGAALVRSQSTSTKYLYQIVRVSPGGWYEASAYLEAGAGVDAAWVRIAWYASGDGGGSQLATGDAPPLNGGAGEVRTGPLQAPAEAHTAQVRVMLRPLGAALAQLTVDDVRFDATSAPPAPPPTPASTSTAVPGVAGVPTAGTPATVASGPPTEATPAPRLVAGRPVEDSGGTATAGGTRQNGGTASSGGSRAAEASSAVGPSGARDDPAGTPRLEGFATEILLRITELMPDTNEPGNDADFEWVEVSNVGTAPVALGGIVLRDNAGVVTLPDLTLQPGTSLVLAGPRAAVPQASAFWPPGGLSNGVGNSGDRLALLAAGGRLIDALSYGSDATYDNPPLPAPGAGHSLKRFFGDDGTFAGYEVSSEPTPGRLDPPPARVERAEGTSNEAKAAAEGPNGDRSTTYFLVGLAVVALAGATGQRVWALRRGGGGPAADGA
ncbi:MAG: lamin tail domain-containing protein [Dehalococcoidia bacterium]